MAGLLGAGADRELARRMGGAVLWPDDPDYDVARHTFNGMIDRHPVAIVRPTDVHDVAAAVMWAGEHDLGISVRGGGHSVAGHAVGDGALMIDLSLLRNVSVDPTTAIAEADGGCQLVDLDRATSAHGLAAPSGTYLDTGIGGLTLGGGISYLLGCAGFACDALVGAEVVTADAVHLRRTPVPIQYRPRPYPWTVHG